MRLHHQSSGEGPPLCILHGLFGSGANWLGLTPGLSERYRVIVLDARNHGQSPHAESMTYAEMAEDVRDTLRWLGVPQVGLIGHSMGGKTAMQCALSFPECVSRLMVADISPRAYEPKHVRILEALLRLEPSCAVNRTEMERALEADVPDLAVRRFLLKDLKVKEGVYAWQMNLPAIAVCYSGLNQEIHGEPSAIPACFVAGEQSDYLKAGDRPCIQRLFPRAVFENVAGAGHWLHAEQPRRFLEIVTKFFG